ncbi:hypothetical protein CTAYLR_009931 [Chrysophaeum taylorii]|uniref:Uncharacterized protein n=1 Tax=Chrysophaeum taylorii TaxID=2483200 RepID=A0AAD7UI47_9STRA|nr:hypothetical protein CTAYLR_009931 [Chrysophaeum taylorii]
MKASFADDIDGMWPTITHRELMPTEPTLTKARRQTPSRHLERQPLVARLRVTSEHLNALRVSLRGTGAAPLPRAIELANGAPELAAYVVAHGLAVKLANGAPELAADVVAHTLSERAPLRSALGTAVVISHVLAQLSSHGNTERDPLERSDAMPLARPDKSADNASIDPTDGRTERYADQGTLFDADSTTNASPYTKPKRNANVVSNDCAKPA